VPKALIVSLLLCFCARTGADAWMPLGHRGRPNCAQKSCVVRQGSEVYEVNLVIEAKPELSYLDRITIKNATDGRTQEFETPAVSAVKKGEPFKLYIMNLQGSRYLDLALYAFDSAQAGPAYYYFLYDEEAHAFVQSESTIPKLIRDAKDKALKTELQGVAFEITDHRLKEK